jgi:hypothetical protein
MLVGLSCLGVPAYAEPIFQVYAYGGMAGDQGQDQDTWFTTGSPVPLIVVSSLGGTSTNTVKIENIRLIASAPEGESGTISVTRGASTLTLMTGLGSVSEDRLSNYAGLDGYNLKADFLPPDADFNNHFPFKDEISDFFIFDLGLGELNKTNTPLATIHNYDADGSGTISTLTNRYGREDRLSVSFTGFSKLHFDVYGLVTDVEGKKKIYYDSDWEINPGSHDSTAGGGSGGPPPPVPLPAAGVGGVLLLGGTALRRVFGRSRQSV